jgi:hypothetical protein
MSVRSNIQSIGSDRQDWRSTCKMYESVDQDRQLEVLVSRLKWGRVETHSLESDCSPGRSHKPVQ